MKFEYDKSADVLYVTLEETEPRLCRFTENENGDVLKIDRTSGGVVGVTIICFLSRIQKGFPVDIPEVGAARLKSEATKLLKKRRA